MNGPSARTLWQGTIVLLASLAVIAISGPASAAPTQRSNLGTVQIASVEGVAGQLSTSAAAFQPSASFGAVDAGIVDDASRPLAGPCPYAGGHPSINIINGSGFRSVTQHAQCLLNYWGYNIAVDGQFGPQTEAAVRAHQLDCGITDDGWIGPDTWRELHPDTANRACGS